MLTEKIMLVTTIGENMTHKTIYQQTKEVNKKRMGIVYYQKRTSLTICKSYRGT